MGEDVLQVLFGVVISALFLWQGILLRQFSKSIDKLENRIEHMALDSAETRERMIRVEAKIDGGI